MSTKRSSIARNTERMLWAESMGHCMNPNCEKMLIADDSNIGEMAHIIPSARGGTTEADNLILLCRNCHKSGDDSAKSRKNELFFEWKKTGQQRIKEVYEKRFDSFAELKEKIVPLLNRNYEIFKSYGPDTNNPNAHFLWLKNEKALVINNEKICFYLSGNMRLLQYDNKEICKKFFNHAKEFKITREDDSKIRINLFPDEFLSVFGIKKCDQGIVSNVSALQNFIRHLMREKRFINLEIIPRSVLIYMQKNKARKLYLDDAPNVRQIYFSSRFYQPKTTDVRLEKLQFLLNWLNDRDILFEISDFCDLTRITIIDKNRKEHQVKLYYSYCLSLSDLQSSEIESGWIVVNTHNWNDGPINDDAFSYAQNIGIKLFNQTQFFVFCHNEIK